MGHDRENRSHPNAAGVEHIVLFAMIVGYLFALIPRFAITVNVEEIATNFSLRPMDLGLLAAIYFYPYALMQIPSGLLSDLTRPQSLIVVSLIATAAGNVLFAQAPSYNLALLGRIITGFAASLIYVPILKYIADNTPGDKYSMYSGILIGMNSLCTIIVNGALVSMGEAYGWKSYFYVASAGTIAMAIFIKIIDIGIPTTSSQATKQSRERRTGNILDVIAEVCTNKKAWPLFLRSFVTYGIMMSFQMVWAGPYMLDLLGLSRAQTGFILSLMAIGTLCSSVTGGLIANKVLGSDRKTVLLSLILTTASWIPLVLWIDKMTSISIALILFINGFAYGLGSGTALAQLKQLYPAHLVGTAMGVNSLCLSGGSAILPVMFGWIMQQNTGSMRTQFQLGFLVQIALLLTTLVCLWFFSIDYHGEERLGDLVIAKEE